MYKILKDDFSYNSISSFIVLLAYRICNYFYVHDHKLAAWALDKVFSFLKCIMSNGSQISYKATIGKRLRLPHKAFGVVISRYATIGNGCTIFHLVTLGINEKKQDKRIVIGDDCYLSVGVKVISCSLQQGTVVTPNTVVYRDIKEPVIVKG